MCPGMVEEWIICRCIYRVLVICKMWSTMLLQSKGSHLVKHQHHGKCHHLEAMTVSRTQFPWCSAATRLSLPSSCEHLRSAPPWFWVGRMGQEDDGGGLPQSHPEGSRKADGKPRTRWGRRGSRESVGRSSQPGRTGRGRRLEETSRQSGEQHLSLILPCLWPWRGWRWGWGCSWTLGASETPAGWRGWRRTDWL